VARELVIAWVGRNDRGPYRELCDDYEGRIARFVPIREAVVRVKRVEAARQREVEAEALLAAVPSQSLLVALDRQGRQRASVELAQWLERLQAQWPHPICFAVGSDLGLAPRILDRARESLSLGPLTLPHELARLVLVEQIYRALAIRHGIKYHRAPFPDGGRDKAVADDRTGSA
jgi:23S rRNA (pseudouridine1915-N3)-methyltransferase